MKNICILGCSNTEGTELPDSDLIDNYWDFLKIPAEEYLNMPHLKDIFLKHWDKVMEFYNFDYLKYNEDCRKLSWVGQLRKISMNNKVRINDYSRIAMGIDFFHYVYLNSNKEKLMKSFYNINNYENLRNSMINSDLLIWQQTNEPRYFLDIKNVDKNLAATCIAEFKDEFKDMDIPKWKQKILVKYYFNCYNEDRFIQEKIQFIKYIAFKRALLKKKTLFVLFYKSSLKDGEWKVEKNEYINWVGFDGHADGLIEQLINEDKIKLEETYCKFRHPSRKLHILIGQYIHNYILEKGMIE